jgi:hypothetical protein
VHVDAHCDDGFEVIMIESQELMCPTVEELRFEWFYRAADGTWGEPPFLVPQEPRISVQTPLAADQAVALAPGTQHAWLFRVMLVRFFCFPFINVSIVYSSLRLWPFLVGLGFGSSFGARTCLSNVYVPVRYGFGTVRYLKQVLQVPYGTVNGHGYMLYGLVSVKTTCLIPLWVEL